MSGAYLGKRSEQEEIEFVSESIWKCLKIISFILGCVAVGTLVFFMLEKQLWRVFISLLGSQPCDQAATE